MIEQKTGFDELYDLTAEARSALRVGGAPGGFGPLTLRLLVALSQAVIEHIATPEKQTGEPK